MTDRDFTGVIIGEGEWKDFIERQEYKNKKHADESSYLWDQIIQRTCQNALDGTLIGNANLLRGRSAVHEMAREPRFSRRALADGMIRAIRDFPETHGRMVRQVNLMPSFKEAKAYVFLQLKCEDITDYDGTYRPMRQTLLEVACGAARTSTHI